MRQRKKHFKCDAPDRGGETRVAHACTFLVKAGSGPRSCAWSKLAHWGWAGCWAEDGSRGSLIEGWPKRLELLIARNFGERSIGVCLRLHSCYLRQAF